MHVLGNFSESVKNAIVFLGLLVCLLSTGQVGCAQSKRPPTTKEQALKDVKLQSINGWHEVISEKNRLRVMFPSEPAIISGEVISIEGYRLTEGKTKWEAEFSEFDGAGINDERRLREAYRGSAEATANNRGKLLKQTDVILNGRLGTEFIFEDRDAITYTRAFLVGRRMYMLSVTRNKTANGDSMIPQDVQQFFDSFTFWD